MGDQPRLPDMTMSMSPDGGLFHAMVAIALEDLRVEAKEDRHYQIRRLALREARRLFRIEKRKGK